MQDRAIVTALSPNMWHDYLSFYQSVRHFHDCPIYLICLELEDEQLTAIAGQNNVHAIVMDADQIADYKKVDKHWRQWFKPFYFEMVPNHTTMLWLDVDLVVLDTLEPLFAEAERRFFVVADYFAPKSCLNRPELYKKHKLDIPKEKASIALNSGVIGLQLARDRSIVKLWQRKINLAAINPEIRSWLALYDQGALLWALQELEMYNNILNRKPWNQPAKKNPYELSPTLLSDIAADNEGATVAHFAGLPKLSQLCELNHQQSVNTFKRKREGHEIRRVVVTGLESAGLDQFAIALRKASNGECWVRHNYRPTLAHEVQLRHNNYDHNTDIFKHRLLVLNRQDCGLVCEANKNLAYFIKEISAATNNLTRFVVVMRDPISLLRRRLLNFVTWPDELYKTPDYYQADYRRFMELGLDTSNNYFRIRPANVLGLVDLHLWEIEQWLSTVMKSLAELPTTHYRLVWAEHLRAEAFQLAKFAGGSKVDAKTVEKSIKTEPDNRYCSRSSIDWIDSLLDSRVVEIYDRFKAAVRGLEIPYSGV